MFSGISCLFCVNYGHSVMSELRSDWQAEARPTIDEDWNRKRQGAGIALKRLVFMDFATDVTGIVVYSSQIQFEPTGFGLGNGDFDLDVWNCWVYAAR